MLGRRGGLGRGEWGVGRVYDISALGWGVLSVAGIVYGLALIWRARS